MNLIEQVTVLDLLVKGFIIGVVVSAPLGPVGVLCIQRTLNKGRWYGFVTGLGASLSDIAYALLTGYGMSFMFDFIAANQMYLQLLGSVMFLVLVSIRLEAILCSRYDPFRKIKVPICIILSLHLCYTIQPSDYLSFHRTFCSLCFCSSRHSYL